MLHFYPRSPCGERPLTYADNMTDPKFLSTLSLRRATRPSLSGTAQHTYFYPRSPCGERHEELILDEQMKEISIHALLAESDSVRLKSILHS